MKKELYYLSKTRFKRFWFRFKNQYRIHHHWASLWLIIKIAWAQSKKPKSLFNYKNPEDEEFKKCWALNNLRPLKAKENLRRKKSL